VAANRLGHRARHGWVVALIVYFWTLPTPDYAAVQFLLLLLFLAPLMLGLAYLIRRFIEGLPG
jgi:NADH:ubiquinone oxidoreductase subunit 3 (subunit A)